MHFFYRLILPRTKEIVKAKSRRERASATVARVSVKNVPEKGRPSKDAPGKAKNRSQKRDKKQKGYPKGLRIGECTFCGCANLTIITFRKGYSLGENALQNCGAEIITKRVQTPPPICVLLPSCGKHQRNGKSPSASSRGPFRTIKRTKTTIFMEVTHENHPIQ